MKRKPKEKSDTQKQPGDKTKEAEELQAEIENLQKEKDELFAKLQRVSADYANFQKRTPKQIADSIAFEKERIIKTLLPALDNLEHTLASAHTSESINVLVKGIRIIYEQMLDILKLHGTEQIKALDCKFDPALHQAMMRKHDSEKDEDIVLEEVQKGYRLNGRVIRPSKVVVNKAPVEQQTQPSEKSQQQQTDNENETVDNQ